MPYIKTALFRPIRDSLVRLIQCEKQITNLAKHLKQRQKQKEKLETEVESKISYLLNELGKKNKQFSLYLRKDAPKDDLAEHLYGYIGVVSNEVYLNFSLKNVLKEKTSTAKLILSFDYSTGQSEYNRIDKCLNILTSIMSLNISFVGGTPESGFWLLLTKSNTKIKAS